MSTQMPKPPSPRSAMNYPKVTLALGLIFLVMGGFAEPPVYITFISVGVLLLIISSLMDDIKRNFVGLVVLTTVIEKQTKDNEQIVAALKELSKKSAQQQSRIADLFQQHNVVVDEIETVRGHNRIGRWPSPPE